MPNFGLVINSTYNPMSFEQYSAPFEKYAKVYNEMADAFDTLEMEANKWEKLASSSQDQAQYEQYKKYARDLRAAANDLAENGLSTKTRGLVSSLRGRYASEIQPIEDAYNYRAKLAEEQRKLNPKGDLQWDIDFSKIGLGEIMSNPALSYSPGRSLSEMEQAGEDIGKAASTRRVLSEKARDMGNQYYRVMKGYDGGDVQAFLDKNANDPAFQELMQLYDQVRTSYGTNNTQSIYSAEQNSVADERILTGMLKGLAYNESYQTNYGSNPSSRKEKNTGTEDLESLQYVGYETTISEGNTTKSYTTINNAGKLSYYDDKGKLVTDKSIIDQLEKQKSEGRYYLQPHNNNADIVTVMDAKTRMPLTQNGKYIEFNRKTHQWDAVNKKIIEIQSNKKSKVAKIPSGSVIVSSPGKLFKAKQQSGEAKSLTKEDIEKLKLSESNRIKFEDIDAAELLSIPEDVRKASDNYLFYRYEQDDLGRLFSGNNVHIAWIPTTQLQENSQGNEQEEEDAGNLVPN